MNRKVRREGPQWALAMTSSPLQAVSAQLVDDQLGTFKVSEPPFVYVSVRINQSIARASITLRHLACTRRDTLLRALHGILSLES